MRLLIRTGETQAVEIDGVSPEEAAAFVAALGKEAGRSGMIPVPPKEALSSSSLKAEPEWFLALGGKERIVAEVLARVWTVNGAGNGVDAWDLQQSCHWVPSNVRAHSPEAWLAFISGTIDEVTKTHGGPLRRQLLRKREFSRAVSYTKLYDGQKLVEFLRELTGHSVKDVFEAVSLSR